MNSSLLEEERNIDAAADSDDPALLEAAVRTYSAQYAFDRERVATKLIATAIRSAQHGCLQSVRYLVFRSGYAMPVAGPLPAYDSSVSLAARMGPPVTILQAAAEDRTGTRVLDWVLRRMRRLLAPYAPYAVYDFIDRASWVPNENALFHAITVYEGFCLADRLCLAKSKYLAPRLLRLLVPEQPAMPPAPRDDTGFDLPPREEDDSYDTEYDSDGEPEGEVIGVWRGQMQPSRMQPAAKRGRITPALVSPGIVARFRASVCTRLRASAGAAKVQIIDNFLSLAECRAVMAASDNAAFGSSRVDKAATTGQAAAAAGRAAYRTSESAVFPDSVIADTIVDRVATRFFEGDRGLGIELQMVRYGPGQEFRLHHDAGMIASDGSVAGYADDDNPRVFTLFIYVNDTREGEGRTVFPALDIRAQPKRGRAAFFVNLLPASCDQRRFIMDPDTVHAAEPITRGVKFGINVWVHARGPED